MPKIGLKNKRWTISKKSKHNLVYHIVWCTKYRRELLSDPVVVRLTELLYQKAKELELVIDRLDVLPDYIQFSVKCSPVYSPHYIVQQLKRYTSRVLRGEFKELRTRVPTLWTRNYYIASIGNVSETIVQKYIEDQKMQ